MLNPNICVHEFLKSAKVIGAAICPRSFGGCRWYCFLVFIKYEYLNPLNFGPYFSEMTGFIERYARGQRLESGSARWLTTGWALCGLQV